MSQDQVDYVNHHTFEVGVDAALHCGKQESAAKINRVQIRGSIALHWYLWRKPAIIYIPLDYAPWLKGVHPYYLAGKNLPFSRTKHHFDPLWCPYNERRFIRWRKGVFRAVPLSHVKREYSPRTHVATEKECHFEASKKVCNVFACLTMAYDRSGRLFPIAMLSSTHSGFTTYTLLVFRVNKLCVFEPLKPREVKIWEHCEAERL